MTSATQFVLEKSAEIQAWIQSMNQQELHYLLLNILAILAIIRIIRKKIHRSKKQQSRKQKKNANQFTATKWYPTGWTWNDEKQLWEPPDYLSIQTNNGWTWDDEKKIWRKKEKQ